MTTCTFPGCDKPSRALKLCGSHYAQQHAGHDLTPLRGSAQRPHSCTKHAAGTSTCYNRCGCRCTPCRQAREHDRKLQCAGWRTRIDAIGVRRRLQALAALGIDDATIAQEIGCGTDRVKDLRAWPTTLRRGTVTPVLAAYNRLSMTTPPNTKRAQARRTYAANQGWAPPLAWDDGYGPHGIDNPAATPHNEGPGDVETVAEKVRWLFEGGLRLPAILERLKTRKPTLWRAIHRTEPDLWERLTRDEAA